jgi:predicted small secreted protein
MKRILSSILAAVTLAGAFVVLTGCNTMAGAGQDISKGGNAITREADEHK